MCRKFQAKACTGRVQGHVAHVQTDLAFVGIGTLDHMKKSGRDVSAALWNELHIIAMGNTLTHILNGHILSVLIDEDPTYLKKSGVIGLEVEATGKLFTRNIWLKKLN